MTQPQVKAASNACQSQHSWSYSFQGAMLRPKSIDIFVKFMFFWWLYLSFLEMSLSTIPRVGPHQRNLSAHKVESSGTLNAKGWKVKMLAARDCGRIRSLLTTCFVFCCVRSKKTKISCQKTIFNGNRWNNKTKNPWKCRSTAQL